MAIDIDTKKIIIEIDKKYIRPNEVDNLLGSSDKIYKKTKWKPQYKLDDIIQEMVEYEMNSDI